MMKRFLLAAAACLFAGPAFAIPGDTGFPLNIRPGPLAPAGYCQLTVNGSVVALSSCSGGIPVGATYALICNEGVAGRWRDDGTAPTSSVGQILGSGSATAPICMGFSTTFSAMQWISESSATILDVSFYR